MPEELRQLPPWDQPSAVAAVKRGRTATPGWGEVWGPPFTTDTGRIAVMRRKAQRVRFFDWETGEQVGPEHRNVAPAFIWAIAQGWNDGSPPSLLAGMRREIASGGRER